MKSSRAMLLAAMLFAVPAFANEPTDKPAAGTPTEENAAPLADNKDKNPAVDAPQGNTPAQTPNTNTNATTAEDKSKEAPKAEVSMFQRARELAIAPFAFVLVQAPDRIAKETLGRLAAIEYLKGGKVAAFLGHEYTGRAAVYAVAAVAAYKVYQAMNPQDETDEDDVFGE